MQTYADSLPTVSGPTSSNVQAQPWHRHTAPAQCEIYRNEHGRSWTPGMSWLGYCSAEEGVS